MIGYMQMPADFIYKDVFLKGKPVHQRFDRFRLRHPTMDCGRRAKIFAPFDALAGFNEAVAAKEVLYEFRRELDDGEKEELNRKLSLNLKRRQRLSLFRMQRMSGKKSSLKRLLKNLLRNRNLRKQRQHLLLKRRKKKNMSMLRESL